MVVWTTKAGEHRVALKESLSGNKYMTAYVDGVKVNFTLDTGCSSLSINQLLFEELVRKGVVQWSDLSEVGEAELANGEMHDVRHFTVKRLQLGDYVFHNVRASLGVNDRADADPLLGQTVLNRCTYYTVRDGMFAFEPKQEAEQQALYFCDMHHSDTSLAVNRQMVEKLRPYEARLSARYMVIYGQALEVIDEEKHAIPLYEQLLQSGAYEDADGALFRRKVNAKTNYADQLYNAEAYEECEKILYEVLREARQTEPVFKNGLDYAYSTLCYLYWQIKEYDKAEQTTLRYVEHVITPHTWEYLESHSIEPNADLARLLHHLSLWHGHQDHPTEAERYEKMAKNAGL